MSSCGERWSSGGDKSLWGVWPSSGGELATMSPPFFLLINQFTYSSGHLVPSLWDLHMFYLLRPILFRTFRYFTGLCSSNIPRYFLDFALLFKLLVFYVTCNDISVIYVTAQICRPIEEEVVPTVGLPTPDISQGSFTCPSYTDTGQPFLNGDSGTPPHLVAFYDTRWGYGGRILDLNPRRPHGG